MKELEYFPLKSPLTTENLATCMKRSSTRMSNWKTDESEMLITTHINIKSTCKNLKVAIIVQQSKSFNIKRLREQ